MGPVGIGERPARPDGQRPVDARPRLGHLVDDDPAALRAVVADVGQPEHRGAVGGRAPRHVLPVDVLGAADRVGGPSGAGAGVDGEEAGRVAAVVVGEHHVVGARRGGDAARLGDPLVSQQATDLGRPGGDREPEASGRRHCGGVVRQRADQRALIVVEVVAGLVVGRGGTAGVRRVVVVVAGARGRVVGGAAGVVAGALVAAGRAHPGGGGGRGGRDDGRGADRRDEPQRRCHSGRARHGGFEDDIARCDLGGRGGALRPDLPLVAEDEEGAIREPTRRMAAATSALRRLWPRSHSHSGAWVGSGTGCTGTRRMTVGSSTSGGPPVRPKGAGSQRRGPAGPAPVGAQADAGGSSGGTRGGVAPPQARIGSCGLEPGPHARGGPPASGGLWYCGGTS